MELIPAIDLIGGRVVRLVKGDFARRTDYGDDGIAVARRWATEGATRLHIVDLDGAREGRPVQAAALAAICRVVEIPCQVAGGLRDAPAVAAALAAGADRVVLGTASLQDPHLAGELVARHGSARIVAAIDVRNGRAVGAGWLAGSTGVPIFDAVGRLSDVGVEWFAVTAIERDGTLEGPDTDLLLSVQRAFPGIGLIASGGVASLADVRKLALSGMAGAILGRSLYDGLISLPEALALVATPDISRCSARRPRRH